MHAVQSMMQPVENVKLMTSGPYDVNLCTYEAIALRFSVGIGFPLTVCYIAMRDLASRRCDASQVTGAVLAGSSHEVNIAKV